MQPVRLLLPAHHRAGRALLLLAALITGAFAAGGCPNGSDPPACPAEGDLDCSTAHAEAIEIEPGTGDPDQPVFDPLPADGAADLFPGPQQGYHVFMQVRARGVCPNRIVFARKLREPGETDVIRSQTEKLPMVAGEDGWWILPRSQPTFVCPSNTPGVAMAARDLDLEVTVEEELGDCDADDPGLSDGPRRLTRHFTIRPTCAESDTLCQESWEAGCAAPPDE